MAIDLLLINKSPIRYKAQVGLLFLRLSLSGHGNDLDKAYNGSGEEIAAVTVPIFSLDAGLIFERGA